MQESKSLKRRNRILTIIAIIIVIFLLFILGGSYYIGKQIVAACTQLVTNESTKDVPDDFWNRYNMNLNEFKSTYVIEKISIPSSYGDHIIPGDLIYLDTLKEDTVIMVHGLGGNRYTNYRIAEYFLHNGFNVITYDQRSSNENTAEKTTFGYLEKYDLIDCLTYAMNLTQNGRIGIWGESFGGATAVQAVAYENIQENVSFLILDCPISSMEWMVADQMKSMDIGIPLDYLVWWGNLVNKIELGFSYEDANSAKAAKKIKIPTLVINSTQDIVTPYFMGKDIYDNIQSDNKELWTVEDSEHAEVWLDHKEEYCSKIDDLLKNMQ